MSQISCFHCGLPVSDDAHFPIEYQERVEPTCCVGCQAVAQGIIDAGLGHYYQNRTAEAAKASLPPDEILAQLKLYDLPEVQAEFVETLPEDEKEAMLMLGGITCAACTWLIEQRLLRQSGVVKVELNYSTQRARVRWDDTQIQLSHILHLIQKTGYTAAPYDARKMEIQAQTERKKLLIRLAVAALASMQTMMFALPTYLYHDIEPQYLTMLHWGAFLMVLPALLYSAQPFFIGAWRDFLNKRTGMDTPVAIAITLTFIAGLYALISNAGQGMYFEGIAMFVFFLLAGRFMEQSARRKAGDAAERLVKLVPAFCHKIMDLESEKTEEAAVVSLKVGDMVLVRAGEIVPIDGEIVRGTSEINESMLTGESLPVAKTTGSIITAGTLNLSGPLIVRAHQVGQQTRLAHIVKLLDRALSQKPRLAEMAEKYAAGFTLSLIIMAVPTFLAWWYLADASKALWVTVSLLVITCPCALSLATPTALAASMGKLAAQGILVARGHALEGMANISDAVLDKTGTLTQGRLSVQRFFPFSASLHATELCQIARVLEQHSEHPVARAIHTFRLPEECDTPIAVRVMDSVHRVGEGIEARIEMRGQNGRWAIGKPEFVAHIAGEIPAMIHDLAREGSVIALGNEHGFQAAFVLRDTVKPDAQSAVRALAQNGIRLHILSGDNETTVRALAQTLGITHFHAGALPEDKLAYVQDLQRENRRVLMLGDGINDAPVLAAADVSVAVAGSADVARDGADIVLLNDDLMALPDMLRQAAKTRAIIRQNLIWATLYNAVVVPLAVAGWVTPWIAALGMSASSLLVVGNALRLRKS